MIDIDRVRADTPAVQHIVHLNNCGSSLPPTPVLDAAIDYLQLEARIGGYEAWGERQDDLYEIYRATARYLNCAADEIAFTASASDAWWRAFTSVPLAEGDRVLISRSEFQANAFGFLQARERGVIVDVVPNDDAGNIDVAAMEAMVDERVKLISLTQISMANGAVHDAAAVGAVARSAGALFLLDACQAAGQRPLDVEALQCDFLCYTGRKWLRGMRGTGILYARATVLDHLNPPTFVDGRSAVWATADTYDIAPGAQRFEFGEQNFAGRVALGVATNYMLDLGIDAIEARICELAGRARHALAELPSITVQDEGTDQSGIVTFTSATQEAPAIQQALAAREINTGAPGRNNAQLDLGERGLNNVVRLGIHYFNTEDEVDAAIDAIAEVS